MLPLLKLTWVLWCVGCLALLMLALSPYRGWPKWSIGAIVVALVVGQIVVGRLLVRMKRPGPPPSP